MTPTGRKPRRALLALTVLNAVFLLLLYVGEACIAERHWLTTLVTYAPQQLFGVPTALLLAYCLLRKRRPLLVANTLSALFFALTMLGLNIPFGAGGRASDAHIRMMTYNVHHLSKGAEQIARDVVTVRPDVVCFQEVNREGARPDPVTELKKALPGWHSASHGQLAIFSRYPIGQCSVHKPSVEYWRVFLEAAVTVKGRKLTIIAIHLNTAAGPESLSDHYGSLASYLHRSTSARASQISELLSLARGVQGPLIIAGDFNTPPRGRLYRQLATSYQDSFRVAGSGFGYSYRSDLPVMRIDYIFAGSGLRPTNCGAPALAGSDHRPVVADIAFL